ncbi:hypothetical protein [Variovorax sp. UC74_104]|uniref:hypothetical protein n=1 Tax=Variovorax sp. UC74_104 TaxID=3374555 RepID=UPI0037578C3F
MPVMTTLRHRNSHDAFRAFRLDGFTPEPTVRVRGSGREQSISRALPHHRKSAWPQRLAGLLAFGALAAGIFLAGTDTCAQRGTAASGNYGRSTLAQITATGSGPRAGSCKRAPGGSNRPKTTR